MIRKSLLSALLLSAALSSSAVAADQPKPLQPMWGAIDPFWGAIDPFWGAIDPFWGAIDPFGGKVQAQWGAIDPFWGAIDPFWGAIDPFHGNVKAQWGAIDPFWGAIDPFHGSVKAQWGAIDPFWGAIDPFWGAIDPFGGNVRPQWGAIDPFWGAIDPFWGAIDPFHSTLSSSSNEVNPGYGRVSPFWGNTSLYWGKANPFWGAIDPFGGSNTPQWGAIDPFWGAIDPFGGSNTPQWGAIDPFWGAIDPFWGAIDPFWGAIDPFWKNVGPYWMNAGPAWGDINAAWSQLQATNAADYSTLQQRLRDFLAKSEAVWGTPIQSASGKTFAEFSGPLLAKYGINPDDVASLANVGPGARSAFLLNWYDALMGFSGMPRVDWWMAATNWTPLITQIQNPGTHTVIGVLDSRFTDTSTNVAHLSFVGGYDYHVNDHGAAVASLIASQHTPGMVMGIAPNSPVKLYNPFDTTGTASWDDVAAGINALYASGASIINASLGVPGQVLSDEWATIMTSPEVNQTGHGFVLVKAAGNEGAVQTTDVNWIGSAAPNNLILVGSVGPTGMISSFSNTPGESCILVGSVCQEQNKLKYHFLVAPGENILVSDNHGGVMRVSGTSFSAPLVSGAVALLQDRWPWLKEHPAETTDIIFRSARDLGAPGVDGVYGWGELDITASQSPLSFNNLTVLAPGTLPNADYSVSGPTMSAASLKAAVLDPGQMSLWQNQGAYIIAFESVGSTFRDFAIPLSGLLTGQNVGLGGENKPFQSYLYQRLIDWANAPSAFSFNARSNNYTKGEWSLSLTATQSSPEELQRSSAPIHYEFAAVNANTGVGIRFGEGSASYSFVGAGGFSMRSDFDPSTGGVNPVLGFASGGAYGRVEYAVGKAHFSFGYTSKRDDHMFLDPKFGPVLVEKLAPNRASASLFTVDYELSKSVKLNASFTNLREKDGLLGAQGAGYFEMAQGSSTEATTIGASFDLSGGWKLLASATAARSGAPSFANGSLAFTSAHLTSTAYELVAMKSGLFTEKDSFRFSLAQPLHLEGGALQYTSMRVVNRDTGALGSFSQTWNVSGKREYRAEAIYGLPVFDGTGHLDGYGLVNLNPHLSKTGAPELALGWRLTFSLN